ncbi:hypothetical protein IMCC21224_112596 [Puniceibacterium sp. IMCC21224]|nr:hypothetical protein IMCC21224_112596 [Puniceibacterium sp. IMCC21224]
MFGRRFLCPEHIYWRLYLVAPDKLIARVLPTHRYKIVRMSGASGQISGIDLAALSLTPYLGSRTKTEKDHTRCPIA